MHFRVLAWHNLTPACLTIKESKIKLKKRITGLAIRQSEMLADFVRFHTSISVRLQEGKKMLQLLLRSSTYCASSCCCCCCWCCRVSLCRVACRFPFRLCQLHVAHSTTAGRSASGRCWGRGSEVEGRPMIGSAQAIAHRARMQTDLGWHHRSGPGCWVGSASEHFVRQTVGCNFVRQATATATATA